MNYWKDVLKHRKLDKLIILLLILFILGVFFCSRCEAADPWSKGELILLVTYQALSIIECLQTLHAEENNWHGGRFHENGPALGRHPSRDKIKLAAGVNMAVITLIAHFARTNRGTDKPNYRLWFLGGATGVRAGIVVSNELKGATVSLPF